MLTFPFKLNVLNCNIANKHTIGVHVIIFHEFLKFICRGNSFKFLQLFLEKHHVWIWNIEGNNITCKCYGHLQNFVMWTCNLFSVAMCYSFCGCFLLHCNCSIRLRFVSISLRLKTRKTHYITITYQFRLGFFPIHRISIDRFATKLSFQPFQIGIPISELFNIMFRQFFNVLLKPRQVQFSVFIQIS